MNMNFIITTLAENFYTAVIGGVFAFIIISFMHQIKKVCNLFLTKHGANLV